MKNDKATAVNKKSVQPQSTVPTAQRHDFRRTLDRVRRAANGGDIRAQRAIQNCVQNSPNLCRDFGDAAKHTEIELIAAVSGGEALTSAAVSQQLERMKCELAGPSPSVLQEIAAQRVVATWLQLQHTEMQFLRSQQDLGWAKYWLRRVEVADKLHRGAIASLMLIRNFLPAVAPENSPTVVDVAPPVSEPAASATIKSPLPSEFAPPVNIPVPVEIPSPGANRIAKCFTADDLAESRPKLNGHRHHRLEDLVVNGSNGHTRRGYSQ